MEGEHGTIAILSLGKKRWL